MSLVTRHAYLFSVIATLFLLGCVQRTEPTGASKEGDRPSAPSSGVGPPVAGSAVGVGDWGIDACLTAHVDAAQHPPYLSLLGSSGVRILRERGPNSHLSVLKGAGHRDVAFASLPNQPKTEQAGNSLPEDLLAVFEGGCLLAQQYPDQVDAWEMIGEPDVGYCTDLPERVVAFQKAMYLGIKAAAAPRVFRDPVFVSGTGETEGGGRRAGKSEKRKAESGNRMAEDGMSEKRKAKSENGGSEGVGRFDPPGSHEPGYGKPEPASDSGDSFRAPGALVLMGALALPPGPWLRRAVANGLLEYTDAYNFHFYGDAQDLTGVIGAHGRVASNATEGAVGGGRTAERVGGMPEGGSRRAETIKSEKRKAESGNWMPEVAGRRAEDGGRRTETIESEKRKAESENRRRDARESNPANVPALTSRATSETPAIGLPLWITECGINAVAPSDLLNPEGRKLQADFTLSTARQALRARDVAVFMPFILANKGDPHAMTLAADEPLPAWTAYAKFTRENPWPKRPWANPPRDPNPIVVQWLPDNRTTVAHKVSGSYRWRAAPAGAAEAGERRAEGGGRTAETIKSEKRKAESENRGPEGGGRRTEGGGRRTEGGGRRTEGGERRADGDSRGTRRETGDLASGATLPALTSRATVGGGPAIQGVVNVYNFSDTTVRGVLRAPRVGGVDQDLAESTGLEILPRSKQSVPVSFTPNAPGYFKAEWRAEFVDEGGRVSPVVFALERTPRAEDFDAVPLRLKSANGFGPKQWLQPLDVVTTRGPTWRSVNGVQVEEMADDEGDRLSGLGYQLSGIGGEGGGKARAVGGNHRSQITENRRAAATGVRISQSSIVKDPLRSRAVGARIDGLPKEGFIRLTLDRPMDRDFAAVVNLVDRHGQRFAIWENFGASYFDPKAKEIWLNLADFNVYFWGRCTEDPTFRPEDVREIQLRVYIAKANDPREVRIEVMRAKGG